MRYSAPGLHDFVAPNQNLARGDYATRLNLEQSCCMQHDGGSRLSFRLRLHLRITENKKKKRDEEGGKSFVRLHGAGILPNFNSLVSDSALPRLPPVRG